MENRIFTNKKKNTIFYQTNPILSNKIQKIRIFDNFPNMILQHDNKFVSYDNNFGYQLSQQMNNMYSIN